MANSEISFIHAADLHLDSPFQGLSSIPEEVFQDIQKSTFRAVDHLIRIAVDQQVDFVLLAGDLFDNEKQSLRAQVYLRNAFETLQQYHIAVYICHGNHDHLSGNRYAITYPDNVSVFPGEDVSQFIHYKNGEPVAAIHGFSYDKRSITANKAHEFTMGNPSIPFHIAMLHGSIAGDAEHDAYAPFRLSDLTGSGFDYWALGHIHKRQILKEDPYIVYPGNTQGRNRKETGEKGCYYVKMDDVRTTIDFYPTQEILFAHIPVDVTDCTEPHQVEQRIQTGLHRAIIHQGPHLVDLDVMRGASWSEKTSPLFMEDVVDIVNESMMHGREWRYIYNVRISEHGEDHELSRMGKWDESNHFMGELMRHFDESSIQPFFDELYQHRKARKYLQPLQSYDQEAIKENARKWLLHQLFDEGRD